jgi:hypothetical protein
MTDGTKKDVNNPSDIGFHSDVDTQIADLKDQLSKKANFINTSLKTGLNLNLTASGGSLPVYPLGTIKGKDIVIDFEQYREPISILGYVFIFIAVFSSIAIILG